jgi:hypothetical protein
MIPGCVNVVKTNTKEDMSGTDYVATLRGGRLVNIDAKTRRFGCSKYWKNGEPQLAPEIWSVMPGGRYKTPVERRKTGWTLDESKTCELILCTFDPRDCDQVFLLPFQLYRIAFRRYLNEWMKTFKIQPQDNKTYESLCVFVPQKTIWKAIGEVCIGLNWSVVKNGSSNGSCSDPNGSERSKPFVIGDNPLFDWGEKHNKDEKEKDDW